MSGRILILDSVATNRIVLKVKLCCAHYSVYPCASINEARRVMSEVPIDLVLADVSDCNGLKALCNSRIGRDGNVKVPIIGIGNISSPELRLKALELGVDEVLPRPLSDMLLHARIRSLLRASEADAELRLRNETSQAFGFAEVSEPLILPNKVAVVGVASPTTIGLSRAMSQALGTQVKLLSPEQVHQAGSDAERPDLFIVDSRHTDGMSNDGQLFQLIADLRSRPESRHAAQLVILPHDASNLAAMVLDLGADDVAMRDSLMAELAIRTRALLKRVARMKKLRDTVRTGLEAAVTDELTGLYNRRYAQPYLTALTERANQKDQDFALMMLDIDHFKTVNDTFGHVGGDEVLRTVADCIRSNVRAFDLVARIGGEEFLVAMPETSIHNAQRTAERVRNHIEDTPIMLPCGREARVTMSIGVAMGTTADKDFTTVMSRADDALYRSKSMGRNKVTLVTAA
ncbi:diguanylate cyclase [Marivivens aquimaris]|uniref:diguanylate cyclase n=1 Tax=Marivivens aquimaris TaxID=2774876 RepID=UPI00187F598C|nr:diguanylate cyclase [Marivivens aquimaris]